MRSVLFYANIEVFRGAHLKLWDYFHHVQATPGFTARIAFTRNTRLDAANPWHTMPEVIVDHPNALPVDVFFIGGLGWTDLASHPNWGPNAPVINLIQHLHHADPDNLRYQFLQRPAVRICVSNEVKTAIEATGQVRPPVVAIPNGIDLSLVVDGGPLASRPTPVLIAGLKRPSLGEKVAERLAEAGVSARLLTERLPRADYLREIGNARVTVFLPNDDEGHYLPALEGFAAGTIVVCPDVIGNRGFCIDGVTCIVPRKYRVGHLVDGVLAALRLSPPAAAALTSAARASAAEHTLDRERRAFQQILANLDPLWAEALRHTTSDVPAPIGR